jgi:DNA-directed RNA polymerase subunit RPC12/RpoP
MAINYKICPYCNSKDVVKIVYGYPSGDMIMQEAAGKVKLGGCLIDIEYSPEYHCNNCENQWDKEEAIEHAYGEIKGLNFSHGGYFQGFQELKIDFKLKRIEYNHSLEDRGTLIKDTSKADLFEFIETLKNIDFLNWRSKYVDPDVLDGSGWDIEIVRDGRNLKKHGLNSYPDSWEDFLIALERLSGMEIR